MHALAPNNSVIGLKSLRGEEDRGPKALDMRGDMDDKMKFWFVKPSWCPADYAI
jgi:hypothetical protein